MFLERRTMILQYRISNYMSIGHMVEFKMISRRTQLETTREKLGVLYKSVLYGPEATGKSCFLDSIRFLREFVLTGKWIKIERFAGDAKGMERKTTFQITFLAEGKIYEYGVTLDTRKILDEWFQRRCVRTDWRKNVYCNWRGMAKLDLFWKHTITSCFVGKCNRNSITVSRCR